MDDPDTPTSPQEARPTSQRTNTPAVWVALALSIVAILLSVASPLLAFGIGFMFDDLDGEEAYGDDEYFVTQRSVINAVDEPCKTMTAAGKRITPYAPTEQAQRELRAWAASANDIAKAIDGASPTGDSVDWRDDWKSVGKAVDVYADQLGSGKTRLNLPATAQQISWASEGDCPLPLTIVALDPDLADDYF